MNLYLGSSDGARSDDTSSVAGLGAERDDGSLNVTDGTVDSGRTPKTEVGLI